MITLKGSSAIYEGTTNDIKPTTGIDVNTLFHELDSNKWYYFTTSSTWVEVPNTGGGGGGGFTPTDAQLTAMNSGITSEDVTQIGTNETNILTLQTLTQGIDSTGDNFIEINGVKLYFGSTTPSNPSDGDWWLN